MIPDPQARGTSVAPDFPAAPLLSVETLAEMRARADKDREPWRTLSHLSLDMVDAERAHHAAKVSGDADAVTLSRWKLTEAQAKCDAEEKGISADWVGGLSHAMTRQRADVIGLLLSLLVDDDNQTAIRAVFRSLLKPQLDLIQELAQRVADLEEVVGSGVTA